MSDFTDFITMKNIQFRRSLKSGFSNKELEVSLLEQIKAVKNLNVRAPILMIGYVEVLAKRYGVSKAELVLEMLQSCISESLAMIDKDGFIDEFNQSFFEHMQSNYGFIPKYDEDGQITSLDFPEKFETNDD